MRDEAGFLIACALALVAGSAFIGLLAGIAWRVAGWVGD